MYFSSKNGVLVHLLAMCETLADINTHLKASYIFTSRIRWDLSWVQKRILAAQVGWLYHYNGNDIS
jgi:hypothetical protein